MEELSYVLTKDFVFCVHVRYYFFTATDFHLAASISHFLTTAISLPADVLWGSFVTHSFLPQTNPKDVCGEATPL